MGVKPEEEKLCNLFDFCWPFTLFKNKMTAQHLSSYHFYFKLNLKPRHFVVVESIFLFPVFKMRKLIFEKIFRGCRKFLEAVLKMKNAQKPQSRNQTCQRLKIRFTRFTRQNLAHAQTLFSSVKANHKIKTCSQAQQTAVRGLVRDCRLLITSFSGNSRGNWHIETLSRSNYLYD